MRTPTAIIASVARVTLLIMPWRMETSSAMIRSRRADILAKVER